MAGHGEEREGSTGICLSFPCASEPLLEMKVNRLQEEEEEKRLTFTFYCHAIPGVGEGIAKA